MSKELTPKQNALLGSIGSTIEVFIQHPMVVWKNMLQSGKILSRNPTHYYRGVLTNGFSMFPLTATQFSGTGYFSNKLSNNRYIKSESNQQILASTTAGFLSGIIATPAETIIVQKQEVKGNFIQISKNIIKKYGIKKLYRGFIPCSSRESLYTCGLLTLSPLIENSMVNKYKLFEKKNIYSSMSASIISGLFSGLVTQPFDTIKTHMQANLNNNNNIPQIIRSKGYKALFTGSMPRSLRIIGTFFIINESNKIFLNTVKKF